jgi:hypothetical protein
MSGVEVPRSFHKRVVTLVRHNYAIRFTLLPWLSPVLSPRLYTKAEPREGDNQGRSFTYRKKRIRAAKKPCVKNSLCISIYFHVLKFTNYILRLDTKYIASIRNIYCVCERVSPASAHGPNGTILCAPPPSPQRSPGIEGEG